MPDFSPQPEPSRRRSKAVWCPFVFTWVALVGLFLPPIAALAVAATPALATPAPAKAAAATPPPAAPAPAKTAPGTPPATTPAPAKSVPATPTPRPLGAPPPAKLTSQQILEKLLALGASVAVKPKGGPVQEIKSDTETVEGKFTFERVAFRALKPDETPLVAADYDILDSISEVQELVLSGDVVRDAVLAKLHPFHALRSLALDRARPSAAGYEVLAELPALRDLQLRDTGTTDDAMQKVTECRKLQRLQLVSLPLTNEGLAGLGKLKELEDLQLNELKNLESKGFAYLPKCRMLKHVYVAGFMVLSGMVENLGHCKNLQSLSIPNSFLKDTEVAPLGALEKLQTLDLSNSPISGAVFIKWPVRHEMTSLNLNNAGGVDDAACVGIEHACPKLQSLYLKTAKSGFSVAGAEALGRLHGLRVLTLDGEGVTDDVLAELAHDENLTNLSIPAAKLTDPGAAAIGRLTHLTDLNLNIPPITEAALKSFSHCKALKTVNIGKDAPAETEYKLESVLPALIVHRPEE